MNKNKISVTSLLKLMSAYSLLLGIIGAILIFGFVLSKQQTRPSPTPTPTIAPSISLTQTPKTENKFCGGIAAIKCPDGYSCKLDGNYPDAGGTCVKKP